VPTLWLNAEGKVLLDADGRLSVCGECPCGTGPDCTGTGCDVCTLCTIPGGTTLYATLDLHGCAADPLLTLLDGFSVPVNYDPVFNRYSGTTAAGTVCLAAAGIQCVGTSLTWGADVAGVCVCPNKQKSFFVADAGIGPAFQGATHPVIRCNDRTQLVRWSGLDIIRRTWSSCLPLSAFVDDIVCAGTAEVILSY